MSSLTKQVLESGTGWTLQASGNTRILTLNDMVAGNFIDLNLSAYKPTTARIGSMGYYVSSNNYYVARISVGESGNTAAQIIDSQSHVIDLTSQSPGKLYGELVWFV